MTAREAIAVGFGRVARFPLLILGIYAFSLLLSLPLALAMRGLLKDSIGDSLVSQKLVDGFDMSWYEEFSFEHPEGLAETFGPEVVGGLPLLRNLETLLDGRLLRVEPVLLGVGSLYVLLWAFVAGGVIDRFANLPRIDLRTRLLTQGGEYFFRFVRLLLLSVLIYVAVFEFVTGPVDRWLEEMTKDVTSERVALLLTLLVYGLVALFLVLVKMALDYAKICIVVETRSSSLLAFMRGLGFVLLHPLRTFTLYGALFGIGAVLFLLYFQFAPGPGPRSPTTIVVAFLVAQLYLMARVALKLWFLAGQTVLFQSVKPPPPPRRLRKKRAKRPRVEAPPVVVLD